MSLRKQLQAFKLKKWPKEKSWAICYLLKISQEMESTKSHQSNDFLVKTGLQ